MLVKLHSFRLFSLFPYSASFYLISVAIFVRLFVLSIQSSLYLYSLNYSTFFPIRLKHFYSLSLLSLSPFSVSLFSCVSSLLPLYSIKYLYLHLYLSNSLIRLIYLFTCYFTCLLTSSIVLLLSTL
jgi:hypothetical protein